MTQVSTKKLVVGLKQQKQVKGQQSNQQKALPLKFFNIKTAERFVFKRKDKRCLTQPPRCSLIPVFIHFSDFFPDLVQTTLNKCKSLILGCDRVLLLKPNHEKIVTDDVVWDGPGSNIPDRCWERHGTILRTLDIVQYKVSAHDRKRDLLPIEQELWEVVEPFLCRIRNFAQQLTVDSRCLDDCTSAAEISQVIQGDKPWCMTLNALDTGSNSPTVGDREHLLHYSPKSGVFVREFRDGGNTPGDGDSIPLVTLPCRLQSVMPVHPSQTQILHYLTCIASRMRSTVLQSSVGLLKDERAGKDPEVEVRVNENSKSGASASEGRPNKKQKVSVKAAAMAPATVRSGITAGAESGVQDRGGLSVNRVCAV